jgi:hypothetical protein
MQMVVHLVKFTRLVIFVLVLLTLAPVVLLYAISFISLRRLRGCLLISRRKGLPSESSHQETKTVALRSFRKMRFRPSLPREG